jgi:hypothetical protein
MSVQFNTTGARATYFSKPADTNAATIYTNSNVKFATLQAVNIAATGAASATVWVNNGSTDYLVLDAKSISANTTETYTFGNPVLQDGWSIKVKTSSANNITFTATVAEETGRV